MYKEKIPQLVDAGKNATQYKMNTVYNFLESKKLLTDDKLPELIQVSKNDANLKYYFGRVPNLMNYACNVYKDVINQNIKLIALIDKELKK